MVQAARDECGFAMLAYQLIVVEKRVSLQRAADALGLSYAVLHSRLNQRTRFRPEELQRLVAVLDDERLLGFLAEGSDFIITRRPDAAPTPRSIRRAVTHATREMLDVMDLALASVESGMVISPRDRQAMLKEVAEAERALAGLRLALTGPALEGKQL